MYKRASLAATLVMIALLLGLGAWGQPAETATGQRPFYMGLTPFPYDITPEAAIDTFENIAKLGDMIAHHIEGGVPWTEALEDKPFSAHVQENWKARKEHTPKNFKVYLALNCLNMTRDAMAGYHGEKEDMPVPDAFKGKQLDDPMVKKAYLNYCRRAVKFFKPDYLAIGIEVNELIHNTPPMWPGFVDLYKYVYGEIKKDNPNLPIFASITLHSLLKDEWKDLEVERTKIKEFLPFNDIAGISFYSFIKTIGPVDRPKDAFDWIRSFVGDKRIAITETTFPAESTHLEKENADLPGSPESQKAYYETLLDAAMRDNYLFVTLFLYRDYDQLWERMKDVFPGWAIAWRDSGLADGEGKPRPAMEVWKRYLAMKHIGG
jgi:hypothetical protein